MSAIIHPEPQQQTLREDCIDGRYEILGQLGSGGSSTVYRAHQRGIDRDVALKIYAADASSLTKERFLSEARIAARLDHPNAVTLYDVGKLKDGTPYIAMELLEGRTLEDELELKGPLSMQRIIHLFLGALDLIGEAHRVGIVHRDLKPANLFIKHADTERERLMVLDFGSARLRSFRHSSATTGALIGTPRYYAPEYIEEQQVSPALDIYQLGLILSEVITGEHVVAHSTPFRCMIAHTRREFTLPEDVCKSHLGDLIERALAFQPEERFPNAHAMHRALYERYLELVARHIIEPRSSSNLVGTRRSSLVTEAIQAARPDSKTSVPRLPSILKPTEAPHDSRPELLAILQASPLTTRRPTRWPWIMLPLVLLVVIIALGVASSDDEDPPQEIAHDDEQALEVAVIPAVQVLTAPVAPRAFPFEATQSLVRSALYGATARPAAPPAQKTAGLPLLLTSAPSHQAVFSEDLFLGHTPLRLDYIPEQGTLLFKLFSAQGGVAELRLEASRRPFFAHRTTEPGSKTTQASVPTVSSPHTLPPRVGDARTKSHGNSKTKRPVLIPQTHPQNSTGEDGAL